MTIFPRSAVWASVARLVILIIAASSLIWALVVFPVFWSDATMVNVAERIRNREAFKEDALEKLKESFEGRASSHPASLTKLAIIKLRLAESAITSLDQNATEFSYEGLRREIVDALENSPSDPFLWDVLFWVENNRNGFKPDNFKYLQMSYSLGPSEGWIAITRIRFTFALLAQLPEKLRNAAVAEFVGLVSSGLFDPAANVVVGPGWAMRDELYSRLRTVDPVSRRAFARILYDRNLDDIRIPGVDLTQQRPWR
jgi:hypothetical protein